MARTAVVAGTATATVNAINGRAQNKAMAEQQAASQQDQMAEMQQEMAAMQQQAAQGQPAAPAAPSGGTDVMAELEKLGQMKAAGILTDEEFAAAKAKLLGI